MAPPRCAFNLRTSHPDSTSARTHRARKTPRLDALPCGRACGHVCSWNCHNSQRGRTSGKAAGGPTRRPFQGISGSHPIPVGPPGSVPYGSTPGWSHHRIGRRDHPSEMRSSSPPWLNSVSHQGQPGPAGPGQPPPQLARSAPLIKVESSEAYYIPTYWRPPPAGRGAREDGPIPGGNSRLVTH